MKKILILIFSFLFCKSLVVYSQKTDYYYYDNNWNLVSGYSYATYYRVINYSSNGNFISPVKDYYRSGKIQCILYADYLNPACSSGIISCGVKNGEVTWYYENGNISIKRRYKDSRYIGYKEYNSNGYLTAIEGCVYGDCDNGYGEYYYKSGDKYVGYFSSGYRHGSGTYTWQSSKNSYAGIFKYGDIDKSSSSANRISAQDIKDGLEIATKLVELYKAVTKD